jgi:hypothetical protein
MFDISQIKRLIYQASQTKGNVVPLDKDIWLVVSPSHIYLSTDVKDITCLSCPTYQPALEDITSVINLIVEHSHYYLGKTDWLYRVSVPSKDCYFQRSGEKRYAGSMLHPHSPAHYKALFAFLNARSSVFSP